MSFLYPTFLWSLLAVLIPIAIHLFNLRQTRRVVFTNVSLLRTVQTKTKSVRQLKQWLLLACRVLFLICLGLAFAQPFLPAQRQTGLSQQGLTSYYVDNSYSMQNERDAQTYLSIALNKLDELLTLFKNATTLQLITNDFSATEQQTGTADALRDRVASVRFSHTARSLETVYRRQKSLLNRQQAAGQHQLFWFSDFQKSTVGNLATLRIDSTDRLFLVPLEAQATKNVYVDSVWLSSPFVREMQNNSLNVRLKNSGNEAVSNLPVQLFLDNVQLSTATANLPAGGQTTLTLNLNVIGRGYHRGRITFSDFPITFDNQYFFVFEASPAVRVLHLSGTTGGTDYVGAVFSNKSLFQLRRFNAQNVDVGQLAAADLVVLEGLTNLSGSLRSELERFVRQGGSLTLIPPAQPDAAAYTSFLAALGLPGLQVSTQPLPAAIEVAKPDRQLPFFRDVFEQTTAADRWLLPAMVPVWQWQGGNRLLSLRNGQPALTSLPVGGGKTRTGSLYVLASPLAPTYGSLAENALFVPIMYKMAAMSVPASRLAYTFDEGSIRLRVNPTATQAVYSLQRDSVRFIPTQRLINQELQFEMPRNSELPAGQTLSAGYYEVRNQQGQTQTLLAFNHGRAESEMAFFAPDDLRKAFANQPNVTVFDNVQDSDFVKALEEKNLGKSLWKYFLIAALGFLLAETVVARFMKTA